MESTNYLFQYSVSELFFVTLQQFHVVFCTQFHVVLHVDLRSPVAAPIYSAFSLTSHAMVHMECHFISTWEKNNEMLFDLMLSRKVIRDVKRNRASQKHHKNLANKI